MVSFCLRISYRSVVVQHSTCHTHCHINKYIHYFAFFSLSIFFFLLFLTIIDNHVVHGLCYYLLSEISSVFAVNTIAIFVLIWDENRFFLLLQFIDLYNLRWWVLHWCSFYCFPWKLREELKTHLKVKVQPNSETSQS